MATLLDLAIAADRPDFKEITRSAAARMLVAIEAGDANAAADAIIDALALKIGKAMLDHGLVQRAAAELFGGEIEEPEEPIDEGSKRRRVRRPHVRIDREGEVSVVSGS